MEARELLSGYTNSLMALRMRGFWEDLLPGIPKFDEVRDQVLACLTEDQKTMIGYDFEQPVFQMIPPLPNQALLERISSKDLSTRARAFVAGTDVSSTQWQWSIVEGAASPQQAYHHTKLDELHFPNASLKELGFEAMNLRSYLVLWMTHCLRGRAMDGVRFTILGGEEVHNGRMLTAMSQVKGSASPTLSLRTVSVTKAFPEALHRLQLSGPLE